MTDTPPAVEIAHGNFLVAGFHELKRRYARFTMRRTIRQQTAERATALTALGQRAWEEKVDLSSFSGLHDRLTAVDARVGEIAQAKGALETRKASLEQERRAELDTFTSRRQAVLDKKNPIDAALGQARSRKAGCERTMAQADARLAAIPAELAAVDHDRAAGGGSDPAKAQAATERRSRLAAEQAELGPKLTAARAELPGLAAEERRLSDESQAYASQIAGIDAEQKAAIGRIDGELGRVRSELGSAAQQANAAQQERSEDLGRLGESLYEAQVSVPALSEQTARVAAIDRARAETGAALERSLAVTRMLVPGTMGKLWSAVAGVIVLVIALASIANRLANAPAADRTADDPDSAAQTAPASPVANTPPDTDVVRRFVRMGTEGGPQLRADAVRILKGDLEAIGSTADPDYLPILLPVLRSDDAELRKAAADAIGIIGPTDEEHAELTRLLSDPVPGVAAAARRALAEGPPSK